MKRKLISEMCNEWRSNIWMVIELILVGFVLWVIMSLLSSLIMVRTSSKGYDVNDLVILPLEVVPDSASQFVPYADENHYPGTDMLMMRRRFEANPLVEAVGTGINIMPYLLNYSGYAYRFNDVDSTYVYFGNFRLMTPSMARVYRLEGVNGESPDEIANELEKGNILFSVPETSDVHSIEQFLNQNVTSSFDSTVVRHVSHISFNGLRRMDYEPDGGTIIEPCNDDKFGDMVIRVRPGKTDEFLASLSPDDLRQGNVFSTGAKTSSQMADSAHSTINTMILRISVCAGFMLLVIFLGFLGTFWFRTGQRASEIALRRVNGASKYSIFSRLISEGLILLAVASVVWIAVAILLMSNESVLSLLDALNSANKLVPYVAMALTLMLMAVIVVAGVIAPAIRAMNTDPALTLKDQ